MKAAAALSLSFALLIGAPVVASAETITQTYSVAPATSSWSSSVGPFDEFDPSLGVLTAVTATLTVSVSEHGSVQNLTPFSQSFTLTTDTELKATGGPGPLSAADLDALASDSHHYADLSSQGSAPYGPFATTAFDTFTATTADLADFIGSGTFSVNLAADYTALLNGGGGNIALDLTSTAGGSLTLVYTYTVVPEPSTWAMMLIGFAGLSLAGYRRMKIPASVA